MSKELAVVPPLRLIRVDEPEFTYEEALALTNEIIAADTAQDCRLGLAYRRNAAGALGCRSWLEYRDKYFPHWSNSHFYRLMNASTVSLTIGRPIKTSHAAILDELPDYLMQQALDVAEEIAKQVGGDDYKVTAEDIRLAVDQIKKDLPAEDHNEPSSSPAAAGPDLRRKRNKTGRGVGTPEEEADKREKQRDQWDRALAVLRRVCGAPLAKAIESKTFEHLEDADIILWAFYTAKVERDEHEIKQIERLVVGGARCVVTQAIRILCEMPDAKTKLAHMHNLAIGAGGAFCAQVEGARYIVIAANAPGWMADLAKATETKLAK